MSALLIFVFSPSLSPRAKPTFKLRNFPISDNSENFSPANAFNGTMLMKSKNPFEYQGLSVQVLQGYTTASRTGNNNDNYAKYNHEMRILIDSKKIKQDYLVKVLKSKLRVLRNGLNNVEEVTDQYDLDKLTQ